MAAGQSWVSSKALSAWYENLPSGNQGCQWLTLLKYVSKPQEPKDETHSSLPRRRIEAGESLENSSFSLCHLWYILAFSASPKCHSFLKWGRKSKRDLRSLETSPAWCAAGLFPWIMHKKGQVESLGASFSQPERLSLFQLSIAAQDFIISGLDVCSGLLMSLLFLITGHTIIGLCPLLCDHKSLCLWLLSV